MNIDNKNIILIFKDYKSHFINKLSHQKNTNFIYFGYWNNYNETLNNTLVKKIKSISDEDIFDIANKIKNIIKYKDSKLNEEYDLDFIYGPALYWYSFFIKRVMIQFNFLDDFLSKNKNYKLVFSERDILKAEEYLFGIRNFEPTFDAHILAHSAYITNFTLYHLCSLKYRNIELFKDYFKEFKKQKISSDKLKNNFSCLKLRLIGNNINVINYQSYRKRIIYRLLNFSSVCFGEYAKSLIPQFKRSRKNLCDFQITVDCLVNLFVPIIDKSDFQLFVNKSFLVSNKINNLSLSSLHLSSTFARLVIYKLKRNCKNKVTLFKEHGSSFFSNNSNNYDLVEKLNSITKYRKSFPRKVPPFVVGFIHSKPSLLIKIKRFISKKNNMVTIIGQQWFEDVRTQYEFSYLLTDRKTQSFITLTNLLKKKFQVSFLPSKNSRSNNSDPLYDQLKKFKVSSCANYKSALIESQILVVTYPQTTIFDLIYLDIPFVLFFEPNEWNLTKESKHWYQKFVDFGLAFNYEEQDKLYDFLGNNQILNIFYSKEFNKFKNEFLNFIS